MSIFDFLFGRKKTPKPVVVKQPAPPVPVSSTKTPVPTPTPTPVPAPVPAPPSSTQTAPATPASSLPDGLSGRLTLLKDDPLKTINFWVPGASEGWETDFPWHTQWNPEKSNGAGGINQERQWYVNALYPQTGALHPWIGTGEYTRLMASPVPNNMKSLLGEDGRRPQEGNPISQGQFDIYSGMLTSFHSLQMTYGYIEVEYKMPAVPGLWAGPLWWYNLDTHCEIDVAEALGANPFDVLQHVHWPNAAGGMNHAGDDKTVKQPSKRPGDWTKVGALWTREQITMFVDNFPTWVMTNPGIHVPMYVTMNLAVDGVMLPWNGGVPTKLSDLPASLCLRNFKAYGLK